MVSLDMNGATAVVLAVTVALAVLAIRRIVMRGLCDCKGCSGCGSGCGAGGCSESRGGSASGGCHGSSCGTGTGCECGSGCGCGGECLHCACGAQCGCSVGKSWN